MSQIFVEFCFVSSPHEEWQGSSKQHFYPNVTTLRSGLCYRNSVCLSSVYRLFVCRLSSVTLVHPTQEVEAFGNISSPLCTLAIL